MSVILQTREYDKSAKLVLRQKFIRQPLKKKYMIPAHLSFAPNVQGWYIFCTKCARMIYFLHRMCKDHIFSAPNVQGWYIFCIKCARKMYWHHPHAVDEAMKYVRMISFSVESYLFIFAIIFYNKTINSSYKHKWSSL